MCLEINLGQISAKKQSETPVKHWQKALYWI